MPLAMRVYECGKCGAVIGRDHNLAITIDRAGQARIYARGEGAGAHRRSGNARAATQSEPQRGVDLALLLRTRSQDIVLWVYEVAIVE
jgi:hypothetical protein